jgi:hypothetical protein
MVLAVTTLLTDLEPAVCLKACDQILNFRWHRGRMVLAAPKRSLARGLCSCWARRSAFQNSRFPQGLRCFAHSPETVIWCSRL